MAITCMSGPYVQNATVDARLSSGLSLKKALENGCKVAGKKVGQFGFSNLKEAFQSWIKDWFTQPLNHA